jgi:glycosyltransferase involved in cell wall biosynthesis
MINGKIAVHLRAPVLSASGYGVHSRQVIDYLISDDRFIVFLENSPWGNCPFVHDYDFEDKERMKRYYGCMANYDQAQQQNLPYDISMQVTIPNEFARRAQVNIGITAGIEVDRCTLEWIRKCNEMDLIVVPSSFSAAVISQTVYELHNNRTGEKVQERLVKPIHVIPEWFEKPKGAVPDLKVQFSTKKNLLFVGLWGNKGGFGEDRKNVSDLIRIFLTNFGSNPEYGLVLKTSIITNSPEDLHHTKQKIAQIKSQFKDVKAKIYLIHEHLSEAEMWALYNHPSILGMVSLTHGEGWGLPLLEGAAAGLPVLATDWSGHKDFLREKHGFLPISFDMKPIPECQVWDGVISKGSNWACVHEDAVKARLKKFLESSSIVRKAAKENVAWLEENFSKEAVSKKWREFFDAFIRPTTSVGDGEEDQDVIRERQHRAQVVGVAEDLKKKYNLVKSDEKLSVAYFMPQSFGDVLISTSIVHSLLAKRHAGDDFYFVTLPQYKELLDKLVEDFNVKVLEWDDRLMNSEVSRELWDVVYNPTVNVQYTISNWTLGNGEFAVRLLEEFAKHCNLAPNEVLPYKLPLKEKALPKKQFISITPVSSKQSKSYKYWDEVVHNLKRMGDFEVVQLGLKDEKLIDGCLDYRGISFNETLYVVSRSVLHVSPDTGTAHAAGALGVPHVVIFGSTSPYQCSPVYFNGKTSQIVIDSAFACEPRCYRDVCHKMQDGKNCLSHINPRTICEQAFEIIKGIKEGKTHLPVLRLDQEEMDKGVNSWHDDKENILSLHEYLGLTQDQYTKWVEGRSEKL